MQLEPVGWIGVHLSLVWHVLLTTQIIRSRAWVSVASQALTIAPLVLVRFQESTLMARLTRHILLLLVNLVVVGFVWIHCVRPARRRRPLVNKVSMQSLLRAGTVQRKVR